MHPHSAPNEHWTAIARLTIGAAEVMVGVRVLAGEISEIVYLPPGTRPREAEDAVSARAVRQLQAYARDPAVGFDLPLAARGTEFQRRVRVGLCAIPSGSTRTYGDLARTLGSAARAVGQACGNNPFPIVVPCHRVVAAGGLGGFAHAREGFLIDIKKRLLVHEGALAE